MSLRENLQTIASSQKDNINFIISCKSYGSGDKKDLAAYLRKKNFILIKQTSLKDPACSQHIWIHEKNKLQVRVKLQSGQWTLGLLRHCPIEVKGNKKIFKQKFLEHANEVAKASGMLEPLCPAFRSGPWNPSFSEANKNAKLDRVHYIIYQGWNIAEVESGGIKFYIKR